MTLCRAIADQEAERVLQGWRATWSFFVVVNDRNRALRSMGSTVSAVADVAEVIDSLPIMWSGFCCCYGHAMERALRQTGRAQWPCSWVLLGPLQSDDKRRRRLAE